MPRHLMAVFKVGDRSDEVANVQADTLVIHGADDGLIPPAHGEHTAQLIPSSRYVLVDNMGHNLPSEILPDLLANMTHHINRVEARLAGAER
jgi:pimeloyl-ACP methyl ester carboxylesterase